MTRPYVRWALAALLLFAGCKDVQHIAASLPAAQTPVEDPPAAGDPPGNPTPAGAPFFHNKIFKFHVPWPTTIEVAVDGIILKEQPQGCGDSGCYIVLSNKENPPGQANYVIQVYPPALKRRAHKLTFLITDVSSNPNLTGNDLASKPFARLLLEAINPNLGTPPSSIPGTPEFAAVNDGGFLDFPTIGLSDQAEYTAYAGAVDPNGKKTTLADWKRENGFNANDDSADDAKAVYFNGGDLEFGRGMHMKKQPNGDVAYYVSNYPTVEDTRRGTNLIATVAMDYSSVTPGGPRFIKFYAYKADGTAFPNPDLDGYGNKFLPKLCVICHGLRAAPAAGSPPGDLGARFLPFDLASYQYSTVPGFTRADQEAAFKKLNEGMLGTNTSPATEDLIDAWYGGPTRPSATQNSDAVPAGWLGHDDLYLKVVKGSCRTCHVVRDGSKGFGSFADLDGLSGLAQNRVCTPPRKMPNAKVTYQKFWLERLPGPTDQIAVLSQAGLAHWSNATPCPG